MHTLNNSKLTDRRRRSVTGQEVVLLIDGISKTVEASEAQRYLYGLEAQGLDVVSVICGDRTEHHVFG